MNFLSDNMVYRRGQDYLRRRRSRNRGVTDEQQVNQAGGELMLGFLSSSNGLLYADGHALFSDPFVRFTPQPVMPFVPPSKQAIPRLMTPKETPHRGPVHLLLITDLEGQAYLYQSQKLASQQTTRTNLHLLETQWRGSTPTELSTLA